jgi:hypothetical protein
MPTVGGDTPGLGDKIVMTLVRYPPVTPGCAVAREA